MDNYIAFDELSKPEWEKWAFGTGIDPLGLVYIYWWDECADVVIVRDETSANTYRARISDEIHPFAPRVVDWHFSGTLDQAVDRLLKLPPPGDPQAPAHGYQLLAQSRVPLTWMSAPKQLIAASTRRPG